jgi:hypothetical protein
MGKVPQSRTHRERSQPLARQRFGLLEKHSDYVKRSRDFHHKQDRLKALRIRAQYKNPDEFCFGMINSRVTQKGQHRDLGTEKSLPCETVKLLKTQDLNYVNRQRVLNEKKIAELKMELTLPTQNEHQRFSSEDEVEVVDNVQQNISIKINEAKLKELQVREERDKQLKIVENGLQGQRTRMGKGAYKKIDTDEHGFGIYKWDTERKT